MTTGEGFSLIVIVIAIAVIAMIIRKHINDKESQKYITDNDASERIYEAMQCLLENKQLSREYVIYCSPPFYRQLQCSEALKTDYFKGRQTIYGLQVLIAYLDDNCDFVITKKVDE